jgi:hypothetical protein
MRLNLTMTPALGYSFTETAPGVRPGAIASSGLFTAALDCGMFAGSAVQFSKSRYRFGCSCCFAAGPVAGVPLNAWESW